MTTETTSTTLPTAHEAASAAFADSSSALSVETTSPAVTPASATATPAESTASSESSTATTAETTTTPATESTAPKEPPKWRWQEILEHTRAKVAAETEAKIREEIAWAKDVPEAGRAVATQALQFAAWVEQDPHAASAWLSEQVAQRTGRAQPAALSETAAAPVLTAADGTRLYSAEQLDARLAQQRAELAREFQTALAPFEQDRQARVTRERSEALRADVTRTLSAMRERPHFTAHEAAIKAAMLEDASLSLEGAYNRVLLETVIPSLQSSSSQQVVADMKTRALAATVNPSRAVSTVPTSVLGNARAAAEAAFRDG